MHPTIIAIEYTLRKSNTKTYCHNDPKIIAWINPHKIPIRIPASPASPRTLKPNIANNPGRNPRIANRITIISEKGMIEKTVINHAINAVNAVERSPRTNQASIGLIRFFTNLQLQLFGKLFE